MDSILKKGALARFAGKTIEDVLNAPVDVLIGVTPTIAQRLAARRIMTVRRLVDRWPLPKTWKITLDPSIIELLVCRMFPSYDPGPPCSWNRVFSQAPLDHYVSHPSGRFRTAFGPVFYRGRLNGRARVLVVAQDPSTDELIAHRNLVGDAGQKLQRLLNKLGITRSYVMLNTFLFGITNQFDNTMRAIALEPPVLDYRNRLFDKVAAENSIEAVFAFGAGAQFAVDNWPGSSAFSVVEFVHPSAPDDITIPSWNAHMAEASALVAADTGATTDLTPYGATFTPADSVAVPRFDLPFGIPVWHGTNGTRSHRNGAKQIIWDAV